MTDRLHSTKATLPENYRFGDAGVPYGHVAFDITFPVTVGTTTAWAFCRCGASLHGTREIDAHRCGFTANVIEGEHFDTNRDAGDER